MKKQNPKIIEVVWARCGISFVIIKYPNGDTYKYEIGCEHAKELASLNLKNPKKIWKEINQIKRIAFSLTRICALKDKLKRMCTREKDEQLMLPFKN